MTKTEIANIALAKFREGRITTIESTTDPVAVVMNDQYDHALELLLEEHRWNFAGKRVTLTQLSDDPPFGWDHQYALPSDCIRLKDVNGEDVEASSKLFALEGRNLLTNDDTVTITYVAKIIDTNFFSPSFVEALTFKLASITCGRLTGDTDLAIMLDKQYNYALSKAIHNDTKAAGSREHNLMQRMMNSSTILGGSPLTGTGYTRTVSSTSGTVAAHKHELTDLLGTGATDGQIIIWNDADQIWEAGDAAAGGDITTDDAWVADGDLIVGSGTDTAGILPIGANNEVLKSNGTTAVWGAVAGSGDVVGDTSSTDNAIARFNGTGGKTLQNSAVTINDTTGNINMPALSTVDGRDLSVDGTKLDTIEDNADVTDTANVTAAGALMDSEVTNLAQVKAFSSADYAAAAHTHVEADISNLGTTIVLDSDIGSTVQAHSAVLDATTASFLTADETKLDNIETLADVTDEANVVAALDGATITTATVDGADKVLVQDADDTDNLKTVTAQSIADLGGGGASALADLSDVVSATNTDKFVLVANGTTGYVGRALLEADISDLQAYITGITGEPLSDLSDVTITSIASGEMLKWNGSAWINQTHAEAGLPTVTIQAGAPASTPTTEGDIYIDTTNDVAYVATGTATSGDWTNVSSGGGASQLSDLSDVGTVTYTSGNVLVADGVDFDSRALVEADISDLHNEVTLAGAPDYLTISGTQVITRHQIDLTSDVTGLLPTGNIADDAVTYAKVQNVVADNVILGNNAGAGSIVDELTATEVRAIINVEDGADVTDTTNVTAAGALMDSEVDANIKTLTLPASTTISAFGATLVDDADAATARTTLESSGVTSGAGAPVSVPTAVGDIYIDTTNDNSYIAVDTALSTDWKDTAAAAGGDVATDIIWDAKGDIAAGTGSDTAIKRTVGTNGQVLTADSTDATGLAWTTPDDWEANSTGTIDISNLPFQNAGEQLTVNEAGSALEFGLASKYIPVRKGSAGTIAVGSPVYLSGYNIGASIIEVEIADSSVAAEMPALGLAFDSITNSGSSRVLIAGIMTDLDTSGYSAGDSLYVSNAIGSDIPYLTNSRPTGTSKVQSIARVSRSNASSGSIIVQGAGRSNDIPNQMVDNAFTIIGSVDATKQFDFDVDTNVTTATTRTLSIPDKNGTIALTNDLNYDIAIACSDETTDLTASTTVPLATFHAQRAGTWDEVLAGVTTAPVGSTLIVDVHKNGTTIFSTRPTIDASEKTSVTAAAGYTISTTTFAQGDLIEVFCDQIGSTTAGAGLKVYFNISE